MATAGGDRARWRERARSTVRLDAHLLAPVAGAVTAAPVVAVFALGMLSGTTLGAIAMAIGAELVAVVSLIGSPRLPLPLAVLDALAMGGAVLAGALSADRTWLHVAVLVVLCAGAGLLVALGPTMGAIGNQSVVAFVVFGRFAGSAAVAGRLALFVVLGALVEVVALVALRLPATLGYQRRRLADACEAVAEMARAEAGRSAIATLQVVDEAEATFAPASLFGRRDVGELRGTLDLLRRMRLELTTIAGLRDRLGELGATTRDLDALREGMSGALVEVATVLRGRPGRGARVVIDVPSVPRASDPPAGAADEASLLASRYRSHLAAVAGQLRSMRQLVNDLAAEGVRGAWSPPRPTWDRVDLDRVREALGVVRDAARRDGPARRHALRLAVAVPGASLLAAALGLPRGYWVALSVAFVLKPDYASLVHYGVGRVVGTAVGAAAAALVVGALHPDVGVTTALVALCAGAAFSTWSASFTVSVTFVTALVLVLLAVATPDPWATALDRLLDVSLGGLIAWIAYRLWPTPARAGVVAAMADLADALSAYATGTLDATAAVPPDAAALRCASRSARVAWARAEVAVGRSVEEPGSSRLAAREGRGLLRATIRVLRATHALRLDAERGVRAPGVDLAELRDGVATALARLASHLRGEPLAAATPLRAVVERVSDALAAAGAPPSIAAHLDELVDAVNTASHVAGLAPAPAATD